MKDLKDKILGSMVGGAVGDALGYPVEFLTYSQIGAKYGERGITRYELNEKGIAEISDDTQMSLYTANGILINDMKTAYLEWYQTQNICADVIDAPKCWISNVAELYSRRAPGTTCMSALAAIEYGKDANNNSKGCGGIMRVASFGLYYAYKCEGDNESLPFDRTAQLACEAARLTHKHPLGFMPAGILAATIQLILEKTQRLILDGDSLTGEKRDTINRQEFEQCVGAAARAVLYLCQTAHVYTQCQEAQELSQKTLQVIALAKEDGLADEEAIRRLGEGWTGDEAWYISLYCVLKHFDSFEDAVIAAVNHSGDSDSTGAITGNIMGAIHGYTAIPEYYKTNLELREVIEQMAHDLTTHQK